MCWSKKSKAFLADAKWTMYLHYLFKRTHSESSPWSIPEMCLNYRPAILARTKKRSLIKCPETQNGSASHHYRGFTKSLKCRMRRALVTFDIFFRRRDGFPFWEPTSRRNAACLFSIFQDKLAEFLGRRGLEFLGRSLNGISLRNRAFVFRFRRGWVHRDEG